MCACTHSCIANNKGSPALNLFQKQVRGVPLASSALFHAGFHELTPCRDCVAAQEVRHVAYLCSVSLLFLLLFVLFMHCCVGREQGWVLPWKLESLFVVMLWWRWRSMPFAGASRSGKYRSAWTFWLVDWCFNGFNFMIIYLIRHNMMLNRSSRLPHWSERLILPFATVNGVGRLGETIWLPQTGEFSSRSRDYTPHGFSSAYQAQNYPWYREIR